MCLVCQECGELNEDSRLVVCEACHNDARDKWEDYENMMEFDEGWDCEDCRDEGRECLPCKIVREGWILTTPSVSS